MSKYITTIFIACFSFFTAGAQFLKPQPEKFVRNGNKLYEQKKYKEATAAYQKALEKNPTYVPGMFNLGNSLYQQKQYEASRKVMSNAVKTSKDKGSKAGANYNIGNTYMSEQKWEDAIGAYKQALRNNPQDADAKYNLSYAQAMLKKEQDGGGKDKNKDKNDKNKDQQNKDNKDNNGDQDKDQQNKDEGNKDQQNKDQDKARNDQQRPQPQPSKLSQQQADQLLNALQQEEKKLQDKLQKEKGIPVKVDKDW